MKDEAPPGTQQQGCPDSCCHPTSSPCWSSLSRSSVSRLLERRCAPRSRVTAPGSSRAAGRRDAPHAAAGSRPPRCRARHRSAQGPRGRLRRARAPALCSRRARSRVAEVRACARAPAEEARLAGGRPSSSCRSMRDCPSRRAPQWSRHWAEGVPAAARRDSMRGADAQVAAPSRHAASTPPRAALQGQTTAKLSATTLWAAALALPGAVHRYC